MMLDRMKMNWCQNCFCHRFYDVSLKYLSLLGQLVSEKLGFSEETAHGAHVTHNLFKR